MLNKNEIAITNSPIPFEVELLRNIKQSAFRENNKLVFNVSMSESDNEIIAKIIEKSEPLGTYCKAYFGIQTYDRKQYVSDNKKNKNYEPIIDGGNIHCYNLIEPAEYVCFLPEAIKSGGSELVYRQTRIGIRQIGQVPIATIIPKDIFALNTMYNVYLKESTEYSLNFLLAIINSKLNQFIWQKTHFDEKKTFPKIKKEAILSISIPVIDFAISEEKGKHDQIIKLVAKLLKLNTQLQNTKLETQREQIQRTINHTEKKIDELVYGVYGLSKKEIEIVESKKIL
ncbi:hypothetical protein ES708_28033 [subsurface metagenome]